MGSPKRRLMSPSQHGVFTQEWKIGNSTPRMTFRAIVLPDSWYPYRETVMGTRFHLQPNIRQILCKEKRKADLKGLRHSTLHAQNCIQEFSCGSCTIMSH